MASIDLLSRCELQAAGQDFVRYEARTQTRPLPAQRVVASCILVLNDFRHRLLLRNRLPIWPLVLPQKCTVFPGRPLVLRAFCWSGGLLRPLQYT